MAAGTVAGPIKSRPRLRWRSLSVLVLVTALLAACAGSTTPAPAAGCANGGAARLSCQPITERAQWRSLVQDPPEARIYPTAVTVTGAGVSEPAGLRAVGGAVTQVVSTAAGSPRLVLDLGRDVSGTVEVGLTAHTGAAVRLSYAERRDLLTPAGDWPGNSLGTDDDPNGRFDLVGGTGARTFASPAVRGGERWIGLQLDGPGTASIDYVRVHDDSYRPAAADYTGRFLSNDDVVNRTWYAGVRTADLDALQQPPGNRVFADGAKRDRLVWIGDLAVAGLTSYYSTPDAVRIQRDSLAMFACQQFRTAPFDGYLPEASLLNVRCPARDPTVATNAVPGSSFTTLAPLGAYTAWWVAALGDYWMYTGDTTFLRSELPAVRRALGWLASRSRRGLYVTDLPGEINWHPGDIAAGTDAHTNAVYYAALRAGADIERAVGSPPAARADDAQAVATRRALVERLWDPRAGAFRGNTADPAAGHPQDANVYAVAAGVVAGTQARDALRYVREKLWTPLGPLTSAPGNAYAASYISPYMTSWELWARFRQGDPTGALTLVRDLFGRMASGDPGTMWERMTPAGGPGGGGADAGTASLAHGWSTGPASALPAFVLGIRPLAAGWAAWTVAPEPGDLRWAQGQTATPRGTVVSRWERGAGDRTFRLTADGPPGGVVDVPLLGRARSVYLDGRLVWNGRQAVGGARATLVGGAVRLAGVAGSHTFAWTS